MRVRTIRMMTFCEMLALSKASAVVAASTFSPSSNSSSLAISFMKQIWESLIDIHLREEPLATWRSQLSCFSLPASMASFFLIFSRAFSRALLSSMHAVLATATALNFDKMSGSGPNSSLVIRAAMVATMELATESMRRRWRHVDDELAGGTLPLWRPQRGKLRHLTPTSENHGGHSGATFAYC